MNKQIIIISVLAISLIIVNTLIFLNGIYVDDSPEKFNEYAFNIDHPSLAKLITSTFVHQNEEHISENLIGFAFGVIVFMYSKVKRPLVWFSVLFLLGIFLVPIEMVVSKFVNGVGAAYGFSNVAIVFVGFAFAALPELVSNLLKRFFKNSEKQLEFFKKNLAAVLAMIWFFYLAFSIGKFTNFVHLVNGTLGFVGYYVMKTRFLLSRILD